MSPTKLVGLPHFSYYKRNLTVSTKIALFQGLAGKNSVDKAKADAVVDTVNEILEAFIKKIWFGVTDETPVMTTPGY